MFQHTGPGRRFAAGSTQEDQLLGAFGFLAHAFFFTWVGLTIALSFGVCWWFTLLCWLTCLIVRASMVGMTTTKESIQAIKDAWK